MILLTGASGFVGKHLLQTLHPLPVRRVVRRRVDDKADPFSVAELGEINGVTDWTQPLEGIDCVVHLAAHVHVMNAGPLDRVRFYETNVLATRNLALAAAARGVRRFVFLSSIKVNGESTTDSPFRVEDRPNPLDDYGTSKLEAENELFKVAGVSGMEAVAIRAPLVYGPNVRANFLRLLSWIHKGIPLPFGAVNNARSMVSVWNLCDLIRKTIEAPVLKSGVFMVSDGKDLSTPELIRKLSKEMGRPERLLPVPVHLLRLMGSVVGMKAEVSRLIGSLTVDISQTTRQLGWTPPVSTEHGLARTARWFLDEVNASRG